MDRDTPMIKGAPLANAVGLMKHLFGDRAREQAPEPLRHYFEKPVLLSDMYPESDVWRLAEVAAEAISQHYEDDPWNFIGRKCARLDLTKIYASLVVKGRPEMAVKRLPRIMGLYRSSGQTDLRFAEERVAILTLKDFFYLNDRFARLMAAYIREYFSLCELSDITITCLDSGEESGTATWRCTW